MIEYGDEKVFVELKGAGKLLQQLPHTVNELHENGRPLVVVMVTVAMADTLTPESKQNRGNKHTHNTTNIILNLINRCTCANLWPNESHSFSMRTYREKKRQISHEKLNKHYGKLSSPFSTHLHSSDGAEVRVHHEHCQGSELSSAVPAVRAVDDDRRLLELDGLHDLNSST